MWRQSFCEQDAPECCGGTRAMRSKAWEERVLCALCFPLLVVVVVVLLLCVCSGWRLCSIWYSAGVVSICSWSLHLFHSRTECNRHFDARAFVRIR
jgi:hypothetical protein